MIKNSVRKYKTNWSVLKYIRILLTDPSEGVKTGFIIYIQYWFYALLYKEALTHS